ncbi:hypothetical protein ACS0TY_017114 [Phlomoides rotata]
MRNDGQRSGDGGALVPSGRGIIPNSFRTFTGCLKYVTSSAASVASTVRSAASAMVERDGEINFDQVCWAGFDKLELERGIARQVLLLGFSCGFQVWDVEAADNVRSIVTRHDGPVSFMQMLPKPVASNQSEDRFAESRPLLIICADASFSGDINVQEGSAVSGIPNGSIQQCNGSANDSYVPTFVWFYSLRTQSYVHLLRFRSVVHLVRCSSRVVAVLQSTQIHCLNAATLEREYTILTNPVPTEPYGPTNTGVGPLAVGPRWMAYSGSQVSISNPRRVSPQHLTPSTSFPSQTSNGSLVAHYARESSKQLAAGIVTLGDMGYKKLSRYYSELLPEANNYQSGTVHVKVQGIANGNSAAADNGMVIVRDIVSKTVIAQFRAHKSPILALCFDPSGMLLVTASVLGHNINVFRIMPGLSEGSSGAAPGPSYAHLYRLQRGLTNAVIQDISISRDSQWIMINTAKGTGHLFAISPSGGSVSLPSTGSLSAERHSGSSFMATQSSGLQVLTQQSICASGPPVALSPVSRIRNGSNGWKNTVSGAAAVAIGRSSPLSGATASVFHYCKGNDTNGDMSSMKKNYYLLAFSPSGWMIQHGLRFSDSTTALPGESADLIVEAIQKWNICQKHSRKDRGDSIDMYGENVNSDSSKVYPERMNCADDAISDVFGITKKEKITNEEKHHMYISEAELQMHQNKNPLWARYEIYFQSMQTDDISDDGAYGEFEIERVPVRMLEARAKDLVPVFDYLQNPKFQQGRYVDIPSFLNVNIFFVR